MDINISNWEKLLGKISDGAIDIGLKLLLAIVVYLVGSFLIKRLIKALGKLRSFKSIDPTAEATSSPSSRRPCMWSFLCR